MGQTNRGNKELAFLASAIKQGRTNRGRRLQMQLALNNRRRCLNLVCLLLLLIPQRISQLLAQFVRVVGFFKIYFTVIVIFIFCQKHDQQYATEMPAFQPVYTLIVFQYRTPHTLKWILIKVYFVLSKKGQHISSRSSRHFVLTDQNKLCTHDKNRKRAELWVKINLFNVFVMYALDSAHVKFDV